MFLAALVIVALPPSSGAADYSEPDCPEPLLPVKSKNHVLPGGKDVYDPQQFEVMEGDGSGLRAGTQRAARVVLKAPVHTCRIKHAPGLRQWVKEKAGGYGSHVEVQPFSQPHNFNFLDGEDMVIERVRVHDEATLADITAFLSSRGVVSPEDSDGDGTEEGRAVAGSATAGKSTLSGGASSSSSSNSINNNNLFGQEDEMDDDMRAARRAADALRAQRAEDIRRFSEEAAAASAATPSEGGDDPRRRPGNTIMDEEMEVGVDGGISSGSNKAFHFHTTVSSHQLHDDAFGVEI